MATPAQTRNQLISDLRATRTALMSPEWLTMIQDASKPQKQAGAEHLMDVQLALLNLENEALASFRDELMENEAAIAESTQKLRDALDRLHSVAQVLTAVGNVLRLVGRVVAVV
jgi:hypothetical protein